MKKSILALAVLGAFAGAASAQSSVTLYGRAETAVGYSDPGTGDGKYLLGGFDQIGGSRWGLRGSEDLGGGLRANFQLESGFSIDTGAPGNTAKLFDRAAWVGLASDSLGQIRFGRQDTLTRTLNLGFSDISAEGELTVAKTAATNRPLFQNLSTRVDNAVTYISPSFGGFQVQVLVAAGEGTQARQQGALASFSSGPIKLGVAYEEYVDGPAGSGSYNKVATIGGSYNFGFATLLGGYQTTSDFGTATAKFVGVDHNAYNVGVSVPFGAFTFLAQYTASTVEFGGVTGDRDQEKFGASLRYALSKRTTLYGTYVGFTGDLESTFPVKDQYLFGIAHTF
jgi:predicted porin